MNKFECKHCHITFHGVEAAHLLSGHILQNHKGVIEPPMGTFRTDNCPDCGTASQFPHADDEPDEESKRIPHEPFKPVHPPIHGPIPIERKANPMHLRDVAMNQIGKWIGKDIHASYDMWDYQREFPEHLCYFTVNGKDFCLTVREI